MKEWDWQLGKGMCMWIYSQLRTVKNFAKQRMKTKTMQLSSGNVVSVLSLLLSSNYKEMQFLFSLKPAMPLTLQTLI